MTHDDDNDGAAYLTAYQPPYEDLQPQPNTESSVDAILKDRHTRYGLFRDQAKISVALKRVLHASPNWKHLAPDQQEALEMNCVKVSRILMGDPNYSDNWRDIEGYAKLVADRLDEESPPQY